MNDTKNEYDNIVQVNEERKKKKNNPISDQ